MWQDMFLNTVWKDTFVSTSPMLGLVVLDQAHRGALLANVKLTAAAVEYTPYQMLNHVAKDSST